MTRYTEIVDMSSEKYKKCSGWGARIRSLRGNAKQADFATKFGATWKKISDWENERSEPPLTFLVALSRHYGVSIDWIITGAELPAPDANGAEALRAPRLDAIEYRSDDERLSVERDVAALIRIAFSYFEYADDAETEDLRTALTKAELARHRRRENREEGREALTELMAGVKLAETGIRKGTDVERLIADARREAGPRPSKIFTPDWDVRKQATDAVTRFFRSEGQEITDDERKRLVDALVTMETWRYSRQLDVDKVPGDAVKKKPR